MNHDERTTTTELASPFTNPWPILIAGTIAIAVAFLLTKAFGTTLGWLPFLLLVGGAVSVGLGVTLRPGSPVVLGTAAFAALLGCLERSDAGWDSGSRLLGVLAVVAAVAGLLLLLPRTARRVAVSLLVIYHFGGILTAVTSASAAWVPQQLWTYVYRPYLQFMYLNNAYHFYSPEPGPAPLLWFHVQYEDYPQGMRNYRWVKIPDLDNPDGKPRRPDGSRIWPNVEYTRRLSISESASTPNPGPMNLEMYLQARLAVSQVIPPHLEIPVSNQYYEPNDMAKRWIRAFARHVAKTYKHQEYPELKVTGVKVYRVVHRILGAGDIAQDTDPEDETNYFPYYMGEFDTEGHLKEESRKLEFYDDGSYREVSRDPLLYWLIPIMKVPLHEPQPHEPHQQWFQAKLPKTKAEPKDYQVVDFLSIHAGDVAKPDWVKIVPQGEDQP
jgi:hypothetical protein